MDLAGYLAIFRRRKWTILIFAAIAALSGLDLSMAVTPIYEATATVYVGPRTVDRGNTAAAMEELAFSKEFVTSYAEMLKRRPLAEYVVKKTGSTVSAGQLTGRIDTRIVPETRLIEVSVKDPSPRRATLYANELVKAFVGDSGRRFGGGSPISASLFEAAIQPSHPVFPRPVLNTVGGGIAGLVMGIGLAFFLDQLDTTLKTKEEVEQTLSPLPVIGSIPLYPDPDARDLFIVREPGSPQAEAIRILRTNIRFLAVEPPLRRLLITSPEQGEGKTTVAANLAVSLAAVGTGVLLIECDMRRPALGGLFDIKEEPGLSNVLAGDVPFNIAVRETAYPGLRVLCAGTPAPNPSDLLSGIRMSKLLEGAAKFADMVIIDTPPWLPVADAALLAPKSDGVMLVVRAEKTRKNKALELRRNLEQLNARILGVTVNGLKLDSEGRYYRGYYYPSRGASDTAGAADGKVSPPGGIGASKPAR